MSRVLPPFLPPFPPVLCRPLHRYIVAGKPRSEVGGPSRRAATRGSRSTALQFTPATASRTSRPRARPRPGGSHTTPVSLVAPCCAGHKGRGTSPSGRSFVTEAHQTGADVRSLTEALIAHAQGAGGQVTSAEVAQT